MREMTSRKLKKKLMALSLTVMLLVMLMAFPSVARAATVSYAVTGGNISFDTVTGTITYCDTSVTVADIPNEINGVAVTSIGDWTFSNCTSLTSVAIPNSVNNIGDGAFSSCSRLVNVNIPDIVISIGYSAFWNCSSLTSVIIPNSVASVGNGAFTHCDKLTAIEVDPTNQDYCDEDGILFDKEKTSLIAYPAGKGSLSYVIPNSVTSIGDGAFAQCSSLTSVSIPSSVTSIGGGRVFGGCSRLTAIEVDPTNQYYCDEDGILFNKAKTSLIAYPAGKGSLSYVIPNSVTSIGNAAFYQCSNLSSMSIPSRVTTIEKETFWNCSSLTSISIPNSVNSIGDRAFAYCKSLPSITIPNSVIKIGDGAFENCDSLRNITIPNRVTSIGRRAFYWCDNLTIYGVAGSAAEQYADDNSIPFRDIGDFPDEVVYGDINGDAIINVNDVVLVMKSIVGTDTFTATQTTAADVNGDNVVNVNDVVLIMKRIVGTQGAFPVEK